MKTDQMFLSFLSSHLFICLIVSVTQLAIAFVYRRPHNVNFRKIVVSLVNSSSYFVNRKMMNRAKQ